MDPDHQQQVRELQYWRAKAGYITMPDNYYRNHEYRALSNLIYLAKKQCNERIDVV